MAIRPIDPSVILPELYPVQRRQLFRDALVMSSLELYSIQRSAKREGIFAVPIINDA